ncbi:MAG: HemK/PrmC family methyltransferase [Patescibacteria group bacterium]|nr:HemK/PrmC family methyltransferase [Patescibacteria group bacterium]
MKEKKRKWLTYEKNWLIKHGYSISDLSQYGNMPVEYIVGWAPFYQREFKVSQHVLTPRTETEELVVLVLKTIQQYYSNQKQLKIIEVGTGSGVIAITLLLELVEMGFLPQIVASDVSKEALQVAESNAQLFLEKSDDCYFYEDAQLEFRQSDLLTNYNIENKPDLIIANLPYIPTSMMKDLPPEVADYEPELALNGGDNGLALIKKMIKQARKKFNCVPILLLEIDERSKVKLTGLGLDGEKVSIINDQYNRQRFIRFIP